jgi:hypothetical protein
MDIFTKFCTLTLVAEPEGSTPPVSNPISGHDPEIVSSTFHSNDIVA